MKLFWEKFIHSCFLFFSGGKREKCQYGNFQMKAYLSRSVLALFFLIRKSSPSKYNLEVLLHLKTGDSLSPFRGNVEFCWTDYNQNPPVISNRDPGEAGQQLREEKTSQCHLYVLI